MTMLTVDHKDDVTVYVHEIPEFPNVTVADEPAVPGCPTRRHITIGNLTITLFLAEKLGKDYEDFCDDLDAKDIDEMSGITDVLRGEGPVKTATMEAQKWDETITSRS